MLLSEFDQGNIGELARLAGLAVAVILAAGGLAGCESPGPRITSMAFGSGGGSTLRTACNPTAGPPAVAAAGDAPARA